MGKLTIISFMLFSNFFFQQENVTIMQDKFPTFEGVISLPGKNKKELYTILREWVSLRYNSAQNVIQMDDPESGKIIVKGISTYNLSIKSPLMFNSVIYPNRNYHTLLFDLKDDKFKYKIEITEVEVGTSFTPIMHDLLLPDPPLKPNGKPYKGLGLESVLKTKKDHLDYTEQFKNDLIKELLNLKFKPKSDNW